MINVTPRQKTEDALIYVLSKGGSMEIMKLAKLLYLSDYLYAKTFGAQQSFMGGHARFEFGPVPKKFYPIYDQLVAKGIIKRSDNMVSLVRERETPRLNEEEIACLDKTLEEFKGIRLSKVKEAAYRTEPMITLQEKEKTLGSQKLMYEKMDFNLIPTHPLFQNDDVDISFMDDPEFQKNLA
jgi:hypothetical protein